MNHDNYAPGTANDPNAPWNEIEPKEKECKFCHGEGGHYEDVAGDGGSKMWIGCEAEHCVDGFVPLECEQEDDE